MEMANLHCDFLHRRAVSLAVV